MNLGIFEMLMVIPLGLAMSILPIAVFILIFLIYRKLASIERILIESRSDRPAE